MTTNDEQREAAIQKVRAKRTFRNHLAIYLLVNTLLVVIWAIDGSGEFFPLWTILGWGIGLAFHGWNVYFRRPITEAEIRKEMGKSG